MRPTVRAAAAIAALLGLAASARAGDPPPPEPKRAQTDAERTESVLRTLREPSDADAFRFECEMRAGGVVVGEGKFEAVVGRSGGRPVWAVTETATVPTPGGAAQTRTTVALLSRDLHLIHIEKAEGPAGKGTSVFGDRVPTGFAITEPQASGDPRRTTIEAPAGTTSTLGALAQFLRKCPAEPATYEVPYFNIARERVTTAKIAVKGPGALDVGSGKVPAWVAAVDPDPDSHFDLYFDPADRALLAVSVPAFGLTFAKKGLFAAKAEPPIDTSKPPTSAKEAGVRFTLGLLAGDLEIVKSALDFPAMRTLAGFEGTLDAYTAKVIADLKPGLKNVPRPRADGIARSGLVGAVETTRPDGTVFVAFGPALQNVRYEARGKVGVWRIVRLNPE